MQEYKILNIAEKLFTKKQKLIANLNDTEIFHVAPFLFSIASIIVIFPKLENIWHIEKNETLCEIETLDVIEQCKARTLQVFRSQHAPVAQEALGYSLQVFGLQQALRHSSAGPQSHSSPPSTTQSPQTEPLLGVIRRMVTKGGRLRVHRSIGYVSEYLRRNLAEHVDH